MTKIHYKILKGKDAETLEREVEKYIGDGWQLSGGIIATVEPPTAISPTFYQAVTMPVKEKAIDFKPQTFGEQLGR